MPWYGIQISWSACIVWTVFSGQQYQHMTSRQPHLPTVRMLLRSLLDLIDDLTYANERMSAETLDTPCQQKLVQCQSLRGAMSPLFRLLVPSPTAYKPAYCPRFTVAARKAQPPPVQPTNRYQRCPESHAWTFWIAGKAPLCHLHICGNPSASNVSKIDRTNTIVTKTGARP